MGARTGGSLSTVMMSIPLAAIPLMAIFGIPRFAPVVASPDAGGGPDAFDMPVDLGFDDGDASAESVATAEPWPGAANDAPLYSPVDRQPNASLESRTETTDEWGDRLDHPNRPRSLDPSSAPPTAIPVTRAVQERAGQGTWRDATRRLNELGVHDFQLRPGTNPETFLFACVVSPNGDPKVVRRFESESTEPLAAVDNVLTQIEEWLHGPKTQTATPESAAPWGHADQLGHLGARR